MYMLFLDESGWTRSDYPAKYPESDFFLIGGVLVTEKNYHMCVEKFAEFKAASCSEIKDLPLHASELNQLQIKPRSRYKDVITPERAKEILSLAYKFLGTLPLEAVAVLVDTFVLREKYFKPADPYYLAYEIMVEKYQKIIRERKEPENIFGVVNISHSNLADKLDVIHESLIRKGTNYVKFNTIFPRVNVKPTESSCFFEFADLVCYAYQRSYHEWLCKNLGKKTRDGENYLHDLEEICKRINIGRIIIGDKFRIKVIPWPRFLEKNKK